MRRAIADPITLALIALFSTVITIVFDNESDGAITKIIYYDTNSTVKCEKEYPKIILTDRDY